VDHRDLPSFPTRRSSDLKRRDDRCCFKIKIDLPMAPEGFRKNSGRDHGDCAVKISRADADSDQRKHVKTAVDDRLPGPGEEEARSEEHTSELQSLAYLVC